MVTSRFISERLDFKGRITVAATAVSFLVIILSLTVVDGFRREIRNGISEIMGDVQITPAPADSACLSRLERVSGVSSITPVISRTGIVKKGEIIQGVLFKGIPSEEESLTASIPSTLSRKLGLEPGDKFPSYFVEDNVKIRNFTVRKIYEDLLRTDDKMIIYVPLADLQRVNGWDSTRASALEVHLADRYRGKDAERKKAAELSMTANAAGQSVVATATADMYPRLFDWIGLLDFNVLAILLLMILVAGFNMVSGLLIMLFRHTGTIGTLKAMGMNNRGIAGIFLRVASGVVLKGMAIGNGLALLFCLIQGTTHVLRLNPANYFVSFVPVWVNVPKILCADITAYLLIMLLLLLPSIFISGVDPANTIRVK